MQESDDTASNSQEDANRASDGEVTVEIENTKTVSRPYIVGNGKTLNIIGKGENAQLIIENADSSFYVEAGGTLNISNVTVDYGKAIKSEGTVKVSGKTTLNANSIKRLSDGPAINATNGEVNIVADTGAIVLNNPKGIAINATDTANVTIKGEGPYWERTLQTAKLH